MHLYPPVARIDVGPFAEDLQRPESVVGDEVEFGIITHCALGVQSSSDRDRIAGPFSAAEWAGELSETPAIHDRTSARPSQPGPKSGASLVTRSKIVTKSISESFVSPIPVQPLRYSPSAGCESRVAPPLASVRHKAALEADSETCALSRPPMHRPRSSSATKGSRGHLCPKASAWRSHRLHADPPIFPSDNPTSAYLRRQERSFARSNRLGRNVAMSAAALAKSAAIARSDDFADAGTAIVNSRFGD